MCVVGLLLQDVIRKPSLDRLVRRRERKRQAPKRKKIYGEENRDREKRVQEVRPKAQLDSSSPGGGRPPKEDARGRVEAVAGECGARATAAVAVHPIGVTGSDDTTCPSDPKRPLLGSRSPACV
jgi:hypothetical protein